MDINALNGRLPRCLTRFSLVEPPDDLDHLLTRNFGRVLKDSLRFVPHCPCGSRTSRLLGTREDEDLCDPLLLECIACNRTTPLFDSSLDGYNAEFDVLDGVEISPRPASKDVYQCEECGGSEVLPGVLITYQLDDEELDEVTAPIENFFDAFIFAAKCAKCNTLSRLMLFECA